MKNEGKAILRPYDQYLEQTAVLLAHGAPLISHGPSVATAA